MKRLLKKIIKEINPFDEFDEETFLLDEGILDSLSLMIFIEKIERELNLEIPEESIKIENFENLNKIENLIKSIQNR